jgi:hypothetical protein
MLRARLDTDDADDAGLSDPRSAPRVRGRRKREFTAEADLAEEDEEADV